MGLKAIARKMAMITAEIPTRGFEVSFRGTRQHEYKQ